MGRRDARRSLTGAIAALALALAACAETVIDPGDVRVTRVASSDATEGWAVNYPKQRKIFFAAGRLWIFYADGRDMVVRTTTDGIAPSEPAIVREEMVFGHRCAFALDSAERFHSACCAATPGADVLYRRGTPSPDGTIAWEDEHVAFDVPDAQSVLYPKVVIDEEDTPWVAWMLFEGGFETAPQSAMVARSARTDGTWETEAGFPFVLATSTETFPDPLGVALAGGGTYWIVDPDGDAQYRGRLWRDGAWGEEELVSHERERHGLYSAIADGDVVHVAYGGGDVHHRRRDADGSWSEPTMLTRYGGGHTTIARLGEGRVRIAWLDRGSSRVISRVVGPAGAETSELLLDASVRGGLTGRLSINLNGIEAPAGPFRDAVTVTVGETAPFEVLLLSR